MNMIWLNLFAFIVVIIILSYQQSLRCQSCLREKQLYFTLYSNSSSITDNQFDYHQSNLNGFGEYSYNRSNYLFILFRV